MDNTVDLFEASSTPDEKQIQSDTSNVSFDSVAPEVPNGEEPLRTAQEELQNNQELTEDQRSVLVIINSLNRIEFGMAHLQDRISTLEKHVAYLLSKDPDFVANLNEIIKQNAAQTIVNAATGTGRSKDDGESFK